MTHVSTVQSTEPSPCCDRNLEQCAAGVWGEDVALVRKGGILAHGDTGSRIWHESPEFVSEHAIGGVTTLSASAVHIIRQDRKPA